MPPTSALDTVVLIHGLWMNGSSWERWTARFQERGLNALAPSWPGMEGDVAALRADTSAFDDLGVEAIVDHYAQLIEGLDTPPIIMGHSFGGAFVQILLDRGFGAAGVAIDPAPLRGMKALPLSTLRSGFPVLKNPANRHHAVPLTAAQFHYAFTNTLTEEESLKVYERYAVPGPGRVLFEGANANLNPHSPVQVDWKNGERAPLLLVAGGQDHVSPAKLTETNFDHYKHSTAVTELKVFPERSHYTLGQDGWEEVADHSLDWALAAAATAAG